MKLQELAARVEALKTALAGAAEGLQADIQNLKAEVEALRAQIPDPGLLASIDAALTQVESSAAELTALDAETAPTPAPGTPE